MSGNMTSKSLFASLLAFAAVATAGSPAVAASGGDTIPVDLPRGIRLDAAGAAIRTCLVDGDADAGIVSAGERLLKQITWKPYSEYTRLFEGVDDHIGMAAFVVSGASKRSVDVGAVRSGWSGFGGSHRMSSFTLRTLQNEALLVVEGEDFGGTAGLTIPDGIPAVIFASVADGYDDLGRGKPRLSILQGVAIQLPATFGAAVPLVNAATGRTTRVTMNMVEYVDCLAAQLKKNAE